MIMDTIINSFVNDTLQYVMSCDTLINSVKTNTIKTDSVLDTIYKISMIIISACNLFFAFYLFVHNKKTNQKKEQKAERKELLNNLVLKYKLVELNDFYSNILKESSVLLKNDGVCLDEKKIILDDKYLDLFSDFRLKFTESLSAIDESLYVCILNITDNLQSNLSKNLFDEGVNLNVKDKYKELIETPIANAQRDILSALYKYE